MEFSKCFVFKLYLFLKKKIKNFPKFSDQIYNPNNKASQKCLEFLTSLDSWNRKKRLPKC